MLKEMLCGNVVFGSGCIFMKSTSGFYAIALRKIFKNSTRSDENMEEYDSESTVSREAPQSSSV